MGLMQQTAVEFKVRGVPICRGIAIGKSFFFNFVESKVPEFSIHEKEVDSEIQHFRQAIEKSKIELSSLKKQLEREGEGGEEGVAILEAHLEILQDPLLTTHIELEIVKTLKNTEFVFNRHIKELEKKFSAIPDPFFQERFKDLQALARRIMGFLRNGEQVSLAGIPHNSVVFAQELAAYDSAEANIGSICGFVTQSGGPTSHAAIVAKAKGIPFVANIDFASLREKHHDCTVIVDGRTGDVIVNPHEETLVKYQAIQQQLTTHHKKLESLGKLKTETIDGHAVKLSANIETMTELDLLRRYGSHGIGLFRSEYFFLAKGIFPDENEQYQIYRRIIEKMTPLPVVIRAFDIGGDKMIDNDICLPEANPFLGLRAIRFLLKEEGIFKTQLRAILRASVHGDVSILFPMISGLPELLQAKNILRETEQELKNEGIKLKNNVRVGCMIEVPSAAIIVDLLAAECDFLSIGTNDLIQYSLAVDRGNESISWMYNPTHPSIIRLIKLITQEANRYGIPVTVCGEIASDPRFTTLLLGLGVHELSVSSRFIPTIKNAIRNTYMLTATTLAEKVATLSSSIEIQNFLNEEYQRNVPDDQFYNC